MIEDAAQSFGAEYKGKKACSLADTLIERGIQRGMQQGIQQGILQNAQERVIEILEVRFEEGQSIIAMTVEKGTQKPYYLIKSGVHCGALL